MDVTKTLIFGVAAFAALLVSADDCCQKKSISQAQPCNEFPTQDVCNIFCQWTCDESGNPLPPPFVRPCDRIKEVFSDDIEGICNDKDDRCDVDIDVAINPSEEITCDRVCEESGLVCNKAWIGPFSIFGINDECDKGDRTTCDDSRNEVYCRCVLPEDPCDGVECDVDWECKYERGCVDGECVVEDKDNGVLCDDDDPSTDNDVCQNGECVGTPNLCFDISCNEEWDCRYESICEDGTCLVENKRDGTSCDDGNDATINDSCQLGSCVGIPDPCFDMACDADFECQFEDGCVDGTCVLANKSNFVPCDDDNERTIDDVCREGQCVGVEDPCFDVECSGEWECQIETSCSEGECGISNKEDGTQCDDDDDSTYDDICRNGLCDGTPDPCYNVNCFQEWWCQYETVCVDGECQISNRDDGFQCNDNNESTINDVCQNGECVGTLDPCYNVNCGDIVGECRFENGECENGVCVVVNEENGTLCDDGNSDTINDSCVDGECNGLLDPCIGIECTAEFDCQIETECVDGTCGIANKDDGTPCDDQDDSTLDDQCRSGQCQGTPDPCFDVVCDADFECQFEDGCVDGTCVLANKSNGIQCNDNDDLTFDDVCNEGQCVGVQDVDECTNAQNDCSPNASCVNVNGGAESFTCQCNDGFTGDGKICEDINECETGSSNCSENALCENIDGSFECRCLEGFWGDGLTCVREIVCDSTECCLELPQRNVELDVVFDESCPEAVGCIEFSRCRYASFIAPQDDDIDDNVEEFVGEFVEEVVVEEEVVVVEEVVIEEVVENVVEESVENGVEEDVEPPTSACDLLSADEITNICTSDENICEADVDVSLIPWVGFGGAISCNKFCEDAGLQCAGAWEGPFPFSLWFQDACSRGDAIRCNTEQPQLTCRCEVVQSSEGEQQAEEQIIEERVVEEYLVEERFVEEYVVEEQQIEELEVEEIVVFEEERTKPVPGDEERRENEEGDGNIDVPDVFTDVLPSSGESEPDVNGEGDEELDELPYDVCDLIGEEGVTAICGSEENFCEVDVDSSLLGFGVLGSTSCTDECEKNGLHCAQAWEGPSVLSVWLSDPCERGEEVECTTEQAALTCRCEVPPPQNLNTQIDPECGCHPTDLTPVQPYGLCNRETELECTIYPDIKHCTWKDCEPPCDGSSYDYCCTEESPCEYSKGDCDSDDECAGDLICGDDNCSEMNPLSDTVLSDSDCCTRGNP